MVSSEQWLKELESTPPYVPNTKNFKGRRKVKMPKTHYKIDKKK